MASPCDTGRARAETISTTPSRRAMLAGAAAALAAGAATFAKPPLLPWRNGPRPAPEPAGDDARLIQLQQEFVAQTALVRSWDDGKIPDEEGEAAHDRWWEMVEEMRVIRPVTAAGAAAKAAAAHLVLTFSSQSGGSSDDFAWDTLEQIAAWGGVA